MERYQEYKDSGIEWIGEIPSHWENRKLRFTLKQMHRKPEEGDEIITCFRDGEVTLRKNRREDGFTMSDQEIGYQHIEKGDLVIHGMDGFAGSIGISDSNGKASPVLMVFQPYQGDDLSYLNYLLRQYAVQDVFLSLATTIRVRSCDLNWEKIAPIPLILPPLKEQKAIAYYLDTKTAEIDSLIDETERSIDLLEEYRKSVISEAVTKGLDPDAPMKDSGIEWIGEIPTHWEVVKLTNVAKRRSGHTPDKKKPEYWENGDIVWVSLADSPNLRANRYISRSTSYTNQNGINHSSAEVIPKGSVLLSRDASVGLCAIAGCDLAVSQHFMAYECGEALSNEYLLDVFKAMSQEFEKLSMGSTIPTIGLPEVKAFKIPLPPISEQVEIENNLRVEISAIDEALTEKESLLSLLKDYRKSFVSEAVTGNFKVPGVK